MKWINRSRYASLVSLLLVLGFLLSALCACQTSDTPASETQTEASSQADTETALKESDTDIPIEEDTHPVSDKSGYIPEPTRRTSLTPNTDGALLKLGFYRDGDTQVCGDLTHNAVVYGKRTAYETASVAYGGKTYAVPAYRHADGGNGLAFDLSVYGTDALLSALSDGYTLHLAVLFTEEVGDANRALFSGTEYGLCGLWLEGGCFKLVHYTQNGTAEAKAAAPVQPNTLYFVTGVYTPAAQTVSLYVNGTLCGTASAADFAIGQDTGLFVLGADSDGDGYGSYASYPALFLGAALYAGASDTDGVAQKTAQSEKYLSLPNALLRNGTPVTDGSDVCLITDVKVTGAAANGNDITVTGALINRMEKDRIFRLRLDCPADGCSCAAPVQEINVAANTRGTFTYTVRITADITQPFSVSVSLLTQADTVINHVSATVNPRYLKLDKTVFKPGEDITVTASGGADDWVALYLSSYEPGHDATIYFAKFEASGSDISIQSGVPINLKSFPGTNKGNAQCDPYLNLPLGRYKLYLFTNGYTVVEKIDFEITNKDTSDTEPATEAETEAETVWEGKDVSGETDAYLYTNKTRYEVGETIYVQAGGDDTEYLAFYPSNFKPGKDAVIYWARFRTSDAVENSVPIGEVVALQDFPGVDWANHQVKLYKGLPAGNYKLLLLKRADKTVIKQIDITIAAYDYADR